MKHTQTMYIHAIENYSLTEPYRFCLFSSDMSEVGYALVGTHEVKFTVPDSFDFRKSKAKAVQKEMEKVKAEFNARIVALQKQYNDLLALEG